MTKRFNHMFDLAFSLDSNTEDGSDVTPTMLKAALLSRINDLDENGDWSEACGLCDTYEYKADEGQGRNDIPKYPPHPFAFETANDDPRND